MINYTEAQLNEQYTKLPEVMREAIVSVETADKIMAIGKTHNLHIDQIGSLAENVGLVMLGLLSTKEFNKQIENELKIDHVMAENIAAEVNSQIFLPIRDALRQLTEAKDQLPTQADVLQEIENPPAAPITPPITPATPPTIEAPAAVIPPPPSIFEQKMAGSFSLPKEEAPPLDPYRESLK